MSRLAVLIRIRQTRIGFAVLIRGQILCALLGKQAGERTLRTDEVQITCTIRLVECRSLIAVVFQGNSGITSNHYLIGRSLPFELHAAIRTLDGLTIGISTCMDTDLQMVLEFNGNIAIAMVVILDFRQDVSLIAVPAIAVTAAGYFGRIAEDADGLTHLLGDSGIRGFSLTSSRDGEGRPRYPEWIG